MARPASRLRGAVPILDRDALIQDRAERTARFVKGRQTVSQRVDLRNLSEGATYRLRVLNPRRQVAYETSGAPDEPFLRVAFGFFEFEINLDAGRHERGLVGHAARGRGAAEGQGELPRGRLGPALISSGPWPGSAPSPLARPPAS